MKNLVSLFDKVGNFLALIVEKLLLILYYLIGILLISLIAKIINKNFYTHSGWNKPKTSFKDTTKMY
jgi:hypothetical protein